jgi:hypothetical protein
MASRTPSHFESPAAQEVDYLVRRKLRRPRSPNRYLDEFSLVRQVEFRGGQIKTDCFLNVPARFRFRFPRGRAAWKLRAHDLITLSLRIVFEHHSDFTKLVYAARGPVGARPFVATHEEGLEIFDSFVQQFASQALEFALRASSLS